MRDRLVALLLIFPAILSAQPLSVRLEQASIQAEHISNQLLSQPPATLSSEDWLVLTEAQLRLSKKEAAMDAVSHVLRQDEQPYLQAYGYLLKAQIYGILYRDTAIAITQLEQAEQLLQGATDTDSLALYSDVLQNFAQAYNQLGNIAKAIPYAERSLALALRQQQSDAELKARITLGRLTLQNNAYSQAFLHLNQALALAGKLQDEDALASIHLRLGMAYRKIEYHAKALQHLQQARQRYQALQRQSSYIYTLIYIGETYLEDSNTAAQAASYLTEALTLARQLDDLPRVGVATLGLGRLAVLQQQNEQALVYFHQAQQLFRQQNVQTYLQETNLELAEFLRQQAQYPQALHLLQELAPQVAEGAAYLRYRYYELAAKLQAQQQDWPTAYSSLQLANSLRFDHHKTQNTLQLDLMESGLTQTAQMQQLQDTLNLQQQQRLQQRSIIISLSLLSVLLVLTVLLLVRRLCQPPAANKCTAEPANTDWTQFCQRIQQAGKEPVQLLAFSPSAPAQLKQYYGEQRLDIVLQELLQLPNTNMIAHCRYDDVLWLALAQPQDSIATLQDDILAQLQQLLPDRFANQPLYSLHLPLAQLLCQPWLSVELTALREAFWLSCALSNTLQQLTPRRVMTLRSQVQPACEWRSNMVRQDLLNAIRLGSMKLSVNGNTLAAHVADSLP